MNQIRHISFRERVQLLIESFFMEKLVPKHHVGPVLRPLFRLPLFFQGIGLSILIPRNVLIITTTGRRSGRLHKTPVEFGPGAGGHAYMVMSGWDGNTDWYRNARANPCVRVWVHGKEWEGRAVPVPDEEVALLLKQIAQAQPAADRMWSRWAGVEMDGSDAGYLTAATHFPSLYLVPVTQIA